MNTVLLSIIILVDVPSTGNVDKDKDPSSDTDGETQTHLSISKGGIYILLHNEVLSACIFYI